MFIEGGSDLIPGLDDLMRNLTRGGSGKSILLKREPFGNYAWLQSGGALTLMAVDPLEEGESLEIDWGPNASAPARDRTARLLYEMVVSSRYDGDTINKAFAMAASAPDEVEKDITAKVKRLMNSPRAIYESKMHDMMISWLSEHWIAILEADAIEITLMDIVRHIVVSNKRQE